MGDELMKGFQRRALEPFFALAGAPARERFVMELAVGRLDLDPRHGDALAAALVAHPAARQMQVEGGDVEADRAEQAAEASRTLQVAGINPVLVLFEGIVGII
jgi:hypothetical protein